MASLNSQGAWEEGKAGQGYARAGEGFSELFSSLCIGRSAHGSAHPEERSSANPVPGDGHPRATFGEGARGFNRWCVGGSHLVCNTRSVQDHRDLSLRDSCSFTLHRLTAAGCCNHFQEGWHHLGNSARCFSLQKLPCLSSFASTISNYGSNLGTQTRRLCYFRPSVLSLLAPELPHTATTSPKGGLGHPEV